MAIMYKYTMGELPDENNMGYGNTKKKQGDSKTNVVKGAAALPADYAEGGVNKEFPKENKNMVDGKVFTLADERDY
jgi:hypothetical protein|tara:strand:+ start:662 stop:889 length:228 start_codon:yes stop_codon:yes gene_type:complete